MSYECYCDAEMPTFSAQISVKAARKQHKCYECGAIIPVGASYERFSGLWDGCFAVYRTCALCLELRTWAQISMPCFCWAFGDLHENVKDMVGQIQQDVPGIVEDWARRMLAIKRAKRQPLQTMGRS